MLAGLQAKAIGAVVILLILVSAWLHYKSVVSERDLLAQNIATLQDAYDIQVASNDKLQGLLDKAYDKFESFEATMQGMADNQRDSRRELEALNGKFRNHDLEELAKKKPGLIEKRVNNGTRDTFRMLEESTRFETKSGSGE